jgi:IS30 family transposase
MAKRKRGLSPRERAELWKRWRAGQSLSDIGRALQKAAASVYAQVVANGGFSPPERTRSDRSLSIAEREEISRGLGRGESLRSIAGRIGRQPSTVSREVGRNMGRGHYRAAQADTRAWERAKRPKACKLSSNNWLRRVVSLKLSENWSPEQIAGWLSRRFPKDKTMHVSHETIYKTLFVQARGVLKKELLEHLRTRRRMRHGRSATTKKGRLAVRSSMRSR